MSSATEDERFGGFAMRVSGVLACLTCCLVLATPSWGQSLLDGPLAAPDARTPSKAVRAKPAKAPTAKARAAKTTSGVDAKAAHLDDQRESPSKPMPHRSAAEPTPDPLNLGMKWNGSNDTAEQTRIQNYGGSATGTGASVGLNYHF